MTIIFIILAVVFIKAVLIYRVYHLLPMRELKRLARGKDRKAAAIYKAAAHGPALDAFLWIVGTACGTAMIIVAAGIAWWLAVLSIVFTAWLLVSAPKPRQNGWLWDLTAFASKYIFKIIDFLNPVLGPLGLLLAGHRWLQVHTGFYEKEDLLELLNTQNHQVDNRIPDEDLRIAKGALTFGDKKVGDVMTPRRKVRFVSESETIGPLLMDELHATGFSRFPVTRGPVKSESPMVSGILYLRDLLDNLEKPGKVKDIAHNKAYFINEACTLRQALDAFLKTRHHLLVVVNNFEEVVGVLSLEDVLEQILGEQIVDEFDKYDDLRAVAGLEAHKEHATHDEIQASEPPESVVH